MIRVTEARARFTLWLGLHCGKGYIVVRVTGDRVTIFKVSEVRTRDNIGLGRLKCRLGLLMIGFRGTKFIVRKAIV